MQTTKLYCAYDRKAQYYLPIFQTRTDAEAIRSFTEAVVQSESPVSKYPADYDLVCLGDMDQETGKISPYFPVHLLINGLVALQNSELERARYAKALNPQVDLEELLAERS